MEFTGVTFAGKGQNLFTGAKVVLPRRIPAPMNTRSILKDGGARMESVVTGIKSLSCQSLKRFPGPFRLWISGAKMPIVHAAPDQMTFSSNVQRYERRRCRSFDCQRICRQCFKELPVEYAVEMNNLIRLEMKGSIG